MAADDRDVLKDPPPESEERYEIEVDPEAVAEERERRGEDADRGVSRPLNRKVEPKRETQKHPGDEAEERKQHLTWAEDDLIRAAHVDVV